MRVFDQHLRSKSQPPLLPDLSSADRMSVLMLILSVWVDTWKKGTCYRVRRVYDRGKSVCHLHILVCFWKCPLVFKVEKAHQSWPGNSGNNVNLRTTDFNLETLQPLRNTLSASGPFFVNLLPSGRIPSRRTFGQYIEQSIGEEVTAHEIV